LANLTYNARAVDALLQIGAGLPFKEESPNGLAELQRLFMKIARRQGLLPAEVREADASYGAKQSKSPPESGGKPYSTGSPVYGF
jgi:hypothetical protein